MPIIPENVNKLSISEAFNQQDVLGVSMEMESVPAEDLTQKVSDLQTEALDDSMT